MSPKSTRSSKRNSTRGSSLSSDTTIEDGNSSWEVDSVVGKQVDNAGNLFYKLKWKNWGGSPTWEPEENCECPKLIQDYENRIAKASKKNSVGKVKNINSPQFDTLTAAEAVIGNRFAKTPAKMFSKGKPTRVSVPNSRSPTPELSQRITRNNLRRL